MPDTLDPLPPWNGDVHAARTLQTRLAAQVRLKDGYPDPPATVAGFDVGFEDEGRITRAAAVLLDGESLAPIAEAIARLPTTMPYLPGLLSFRELPALIAVLAQLPHPPDLALIDGHGIAHPRRLGIAAHFGLATGTPSLGVAKNILIGQHAPLHDMPGAFTALRDPTTGTPGEQLGWVLRSKAGCLPIIVSPGHRVSMAASVALTMRCVRGYRLPEPTRLADRLASRRDRRSARMGDTDAPDTET